MKEFKVNDYITLKLKRGKTNIYVKGELRKRLRNRQNSRVIEAILSKFLLTTTILKKKTTNSGLMIGVNFKIIALSKNFPLNK
jgi:hypothetical protein